MHNPKTLNYEFQRLYLLPRKAVINKSFKSTFVSVFFFNIENSCKPAMSKVFFKTCSCNFIMNSRSKNE